MENQTFIIDLYGYETYGNETLTPEFLNNGDYITCDALLSTDKNEPLHDNVKTTV